MGGADLPRLVVGLGVVYITVTTLAALAIPSTTVLRGVTAHVRVDVTGSVVLHASLATIIALVTAAALARPGRRSVARSCCSCWLRQLGW